MKCTPLLYLLLAAWLIMGCSSSHWIIQEEPALDRSDGELVSGSHIIKINELPTRDRPVLVLDLYDRNEYEYPERQVSKRYVQHYRPRYGYLLLGMGTAAMAFYLANGHGIDNDDISRDGKLALNAAGGIMSVASLLNMRPVGEPLDAGESKFLKKVGTATEIDTLRSATNGSVDVTVSAWHNDRLLKTDIPATFSNGSLSFNLIDQLQLRGFDRPDAGLIELQVNLEGQSYEFSVEVESFMERFVTVTNQNTPLRSNPSNNESNIVTNIGIDSQFPLVDAGSENWYRVLFGISPVYINKQDARVVWRPGNIEVDDLVHMPGESEFGDIDIERAIPHTGAHNPEGIALLIANGTYQQPLQNFGNAGRSLELMQNYLVNTLGYDAENIIVMHDASEEDLLSIIAQTDSTTIFDRPIKADTTDVLVYYMGRAVADRRTDSEAFLLPSDYDFTNPSQKLISARRFFSALGKLQTRSTTVWMETDFLLLDARGNPQFSQNQRQGVLLRELSNLVTIPNPNSSVVYAANRTQRAGIYASRDGRLDYKHGIFTYYFASALKEGQTTTGNIFSSMQRNMSFTSRRLHERAQDPQMFGNPNVRLIRNTN